MERQTKSINADISKESRQKMMADNKNDEGIQLYEEQKYEEAIECFTEAINIRPSCAIYYGNRSGAYFHLGKYKQGLSDAQHSTHLNPAYVKGYMRGGDCQMKMGLISEASDSFKLAVEKLDQNSKSNNAEIMARPGAAGHQSGNNNTPAPVPQPSEIYYNKLTPALKEKRKWAEGLEKMESKVNLYLGKGDHRTALFYLDYCLKRSPACLRWKVQKAEVLVFLGRHKAAVDLTEDISNQDRLNIDDALYIKGLSMYHQDNLPGALQCFEQLFRLAPDHTKAREVFERANHLATQRKAGEIFFLQNRLQEAYDAYQQAVQIDPFNASVNSKLHCDCGSINMKLRKWEQAVQDVTQAISFNKKYRKAYEMRGELYMILRKYKEAARDYREAYELEIPDNVRRRRQAARQALRRSQQKDYYQILGVERSATKEEIKAAYESKALVHHPDRHSSNSKEEQKEQEVKFKEVCEAYSVLSDRQKRAQYDCI